MKKTNETAKAANVTELVFILDASGSMSPLRDDTIGGFNTMIEKQRSAEGRAYVTTVMFSDEMYFRRLILQALANPLFSTAIS